MPALDTLKAFWILGVFLAVFFLLPTRLFPDRPNAPRVMRIAGNWARTVLGVTTLVFLLSSLRVLGAITVVLLFSSAIAVSWFRKSAGMPGRLLTIFEATTLKIIRQVESRSFGLFLLPRKRPPRSARPPWGLRVRRWLRVLEGRELLGACFIVVLGITVVVRTEHAVRELRFDQPEQYSALLRARELMLNVHPAGRPLVFPAVIAVTSLLSSADPMQVTRFMAPVIGLFVVLATGLLIQVSTRASVACVAAIYCLGATVFPPARNQTAVAISVTEKIESVFRGSPATVRAKPEFAFGLLFLLLALTILAEMGTILPVAAAILVGCLLALIESQSFARAGKRAEATLLAACLCVAVIWLRPQRLLGQCLEYEAAARATQEIAYRFPRQTWVVAAPVEQ